MNKSIIYLLSLLSFGGQYTKNFEDIDLELEYDKETLDCKFDLYMLLLTYEENNLDSEKALEEFALKFNKLNEKKKEYIRRDLKNILDAQDKNEKEKEKIL